MTEVNKLDNAPLDDSVPEDETSAQLEHDKAVEFFSAGVNAYYNSSLEHDKSLLTLSAAGIGLMITLLTTGEPKHYLVIAFYLIAIACFTACLIAVLKIFKHNNKHIVKMFYGDNSESLLLQKLDNLAKWAFFIGVGFSAVVGVITASQQYSQKEKKMADDKPKVTSGIAMDSFVDIHLLNPQVTISAASNNATSVIKTNQPQQPTVSKTKQQEVAPAAKVVTPDKKN